MSRYCSLLFRAAVLPLCVALTCGQLCAATYYVRTSGDDANDGLLTSTAFRTVGHAAKIVSSGDVVYIGAGTYSDDMILDGVQASVSPVQLIADTTGSYTGDGGTVVVAGRWKIVNSNYVELHGFLFQSSVTRFLVWQGSYEGLIRNCQFSGGDEGLLVKSGSLIIDNCQIENFAHDGLQVDGEAALTIRDSTIAGCQEAGIEIRKVAHVHVENTSAMNNLGDGVELAITTESIGDGWPAPLVVGLDVVSISDAVIDSYASATGPYPGVPGSENGDVFGNGSFSFGGTAYVHGDGLHGPGASPDPTRFSGSVLELGNPLVCAPIDPGDAATNNNNSSIPLTDLGNNPVNGSNQFSLSGGDGIDLPPGTYYFSSLSVSGGSEIRVSGPTVVYSTGPVDFTDGSVAHPLSKPADFQLYPIGTTCYLSGASNLYGAIYGPDSELQLSGSSTLFGMAIGRELSMSGTSRIHADESLFALSASLCMNGSPSSSSPLPPIGWQAITSGELHITDSTFTNNLNAVNLRDPQLFVADASQFDSATGWGLLLRGTCQLDNCTISNNAVGGLWLTSVTDADAQLTNLTLSGNAQFGLFAENCQLTIVDTENWNVSGSDYPFANSIGSLTIDGLSVSGAATACVFSDQGTLTVRNTALASSGYGVAAGQSTVLVENSTFAQNAVALFLDQNVSATIRNSTIHDSSVWAATVNASNVAGASTVFDSCTVYNNVGGISLVDAEDGDFTLIDTVIRDNSQTGLHLHNCNLTIGDQASANWQTLRNLYGISISQSTVVLDLFEVVESSSYAVHCVDSDLTVRNCSLAGRDGVSVSGTSVVRVDATRLESTAAGVTNWGVYRTQGDIDVVNCVITGFQNGIYLETSQGGDQAAITNTTIAGTAYYGLYLNSGSATVTNAILSGDNAQFGIVRMAGTLTRSNNLVYGFTTPFSGTTADASELLENPRFADAAAGDFHLAVGSPAINAGTDASSITSTDLEGSARPSSGAFEIGAYEFTGSTGSFSILNWVEVQ